MAEIKRTVIEGANIAYDIQSGKNPAAKATADKNGNVINETYSTKDETSVVSNAVSSESKRAKTAEEQEYIRASKREAEIRALAESEADRAKKAESELSNSVDDLAAKEEGNERDIEDETHYRELADSNLSARIETEKSERKSADENLQTQIDATNATQNVIDIVGTKADLIAYETKDVLANDKIEVLDDESEDGADTIYAWSGTKWVLVGSKAPYYSKSEIDSKIDSYFPVPEFDSASKDVSAVFEDNHEKTYANESISSVSISIPSSPKNGFVAEITIRNGASPSAYSFANGNALYPLVIVFKGATLPSYTPEANTVTSLLYNFNGLENDIFIEEH